MSEWATLIIATGTPSASAAIWAKVVSCDWPCGWAPVVIVTSPDGWTRTIALPHVPLTSPAAPICADGPTPATATYEPIPTPSRLPRCRASALRAVRFAVVDLGQRLLERGRVVARVIRPAEVVLVRERVGLDLVLAPHLGRIHADLGGVQVDDPLGQEGRLGPARAAQRTDRHGVGVDDVDLVERVVDRVLAGDRARRSGRSANRAR